ncbi:hypothetical protein LTR91_001435 [Friedmanniomyces endolithicus]|uniref:DUF4149 domain-containing protein n=1 Tax=Friedmanniomyces endolithicus TaxID=329885 RepID=A0A4U0ULN2_9PEZI|nr:hypothetical protein LTS09_015703 [Friedmanniomyces endolithicus]KAK0282450.1 hypothetical protein LTR35_006917 [Friedmanniomyces endolithicus]KAK0296083.1 hypothetical protein LTS00_005368 [Friedmanniomyces endolithicus]KAK0316737.1 hypothetical protein LTR01_000488 [Friedmanniomyces endolithicus]KAK0327943.1 hypothetical protein LTR82_001462 [Friedmanniomyces endolithicus]
MPVLAPKGAHFGLILPLCTSSATLGLALFQYPLFLGFLRAQPSIAGTPLSRFWAATVTPGTALIVAIAITSTISGIASSSWLHAHATLETTDVSAWYVYGAVLAAGHLAFAPLVAGPVRRIMEGGGGGSGSGMSEEEVERRNRVEMKRWLTIHTVRMLVVDLPALLCFAEGVALSFWVI